MLDHKPQNRPGRSNSLQRMLELEKQFMLQRLQAVSPNDTATTQRGQPPAARTNAQTRRHDFPPLSGSRPSSRSPRKSSFSSQPPPLVTHAEPPKPSVSNAADLYASLAVMVDEIHPPEVSAASDKPSPKVVAFQFPPDFEDRESVCQSPSWEAYDRRKRERKDEKKEEKRREEERREKKKEEERRREAEKREQQNASRKPRRLSKPPPVSGQTQDQIKAASQNGLTVPRTQKARPASVLGITFASHDDGPERANRKRAGSFTSLIRAPFEARRASFDHAGDGGFIGGIKLEQERFDAQQRADEANIHPALRKSKPESRSSSPPRSPNKVAGRNSHGNDPGQRRAYPPITILNASNKNRSLPAPDLSRMDKLRARVGLKTALKNEKPDGHPANDATAETTATANSDNSLPPYDSEVEKTQPRQSKESAPLMLPSLAPEPLRLKTDKTGTGRRNVNEKSLNIRIPHKDETYSLEVSAKSSPRTPKDHATQPATKPKEEEPTLSDLMAQDRMDGQEPVLLLPPLRPPRKSSKRTLATDSNASSPVTAIARKPVALSSSATPDTPQDFFELFDGTYSPPSLEPRVPEDHTPAVASKPRASEDSVLFTSRSFQSNTLGITSSASNLAPKASLDEAVERPSVERRSRDTTRPPLGKLVTSSSSDGGERRMNQRQSGIALSSMIISGRSRSTSSEEFSSDELQFHSPLSTPGTSRPQSEKGSTPVLTDTELGPSSLGEPRRSTHLKQHVAQDDLPPPPAYSRHHQRKPSQHSEIEDEIELDRIQEAARRVRAAFPSPSPLRSSAADRRSQSDPDVAASAGFLPKLKLRRDRAKLGQLSASPEAEKNNSAARAHLLGVTGKAKSAVHLPQATKSQLAPASPALSPMSLPTPTFHLAPQTAASAPDSLGKPLLPRASRPSMDSHRSSGGADSTLSGGAPVAKMFVECCGCRYYHDMPSRLYETMANPKAAAGDDVVAHRGSRPMTVRCPWCRHDMSTKCCAGLAAMVYVKERLH